MDEVNSSVFLTGVFCLSIFLMLFDGMLKAESENNEEQRGGNRNIKVFPDQEGNNVVNQI
jgi:hypothetical protein